MREWWARKSPEERRALIASRDRQKVREGDRRKQARRRREGTPEQKLKINARAEVRKALLRGALVRGLCEVDGCTSIGHAHHEDYSRPLDVRWLCRNHHDALHDERRKEEQHG